MPPAKKRKGEGKPDADRKKDWEDAKKEKDPDYLRKKADRAKERRLDRRMQLATLEPLEAVVTAIRAAHATFGRLRAKFSFRAAARLKLDVYVPCGRASKC